jgi:hypothetical protein
MQLKASRVSLAVGGWKSGAQKALAVLAVAFALSTGPAGATADDGIRPTGLGDSVDEAVERVRAATAPFKSLDRAVAAGYQRDVEQCVENPPHGGMGFHHENAALMDAKIEVERPEVLTYQRMPDGEYRLTGVEYIVPLAAWKEEEPPRAMGQPMKRAESLGIWYLHVWIWQSNPQGLFADWNPSVTC